MLSGGIDEAAIEIAAVPAWAPDRPSEARLDWKAVDRALRSIRRRRGALDADEARWLREAETLQIWRPLGMVSMLDYLERVLGYAPRTAQDRLRVARALGDLPGLAAALSAGDLPFSAARELSRVATRTTEESWIAAAAGKNLRQIEELVAEHRPGDRPDDPPDPEARTHVVRFELAAETFAVLRQARSVLDDERGLNLPDDAFIAALCSAVLDGASRDEPTGRAKFQIAVTVCRRCAQGRQEGAGAQIAIEPAAVERALCDAQHIGSLDGDGPERAHQDIPPSVARFVWRRDGGRCRVDGCRSSRGLEIHHLIHRADGGSHHASNLILTCSSCHLAHHRGALTIAGTADQLYIHRSGERRSAAAAQNKQAGSRATSPSEAGLQSRIGACTTVPSAGAASQTAACAATDSASPPAVDAHVSAESQIVAGATAPSPARTTLGSHAAGTAAGGGSPIAVLHAHVSAESQTAPGTAAGGASRSTADAHVSASSLAAPASGARTSGTSKLDAAILRTQAKAALTSLGWKPAIAHGAVEAATESLREGVTLQWLIFESLRRCPVPTM